MRRESSRLRDGVEIIFRSIVAGKGRSLGHSLIYYLHE